MAILNQIGGISTGGLTGALEGPLKSLFGNKSGVQMFQYPSNLGNDPSRMHIVQFSIRNVLPRKFEITSKESIDKAFSSSTNAISAVESVFSSITNGISNSINNAKNLTIKDVNAALSPKKSTTAAVINLYLPDTLAMNYNQEYGELSLSEVGGGIAIAGQAAMSAVKSIKEGYDKGGVSGGLGALGQSDTLSDVAAGAGALGIGKDVSDLFLKTQAKALNPQIQLLYRGVGLRTFSMEFMFTPKSRDEADQISAIINTFVYAASPTITGTGGMYFVPPSEFEIKFLVAKTGDFSALTSMLQKTANSIIPGLDLGNAAANYLGGNTGTENDRLYKVGTCVLESVSVDYAPNGWAAHENGAPVQSRLTLNFKEIEVVDRNRLKSGEVR